MTTPSKPVILLVEDYDDIRFLMKHMLETKGYRVVEAQDGQQAVWLALETPPDLIFMDLSMPGMDGWEATRQLRQWEELRLIPIIGLSANCTSDWKGGAIEAGCNDCLGKPVDEEEIDRILSEFLGDFTGSIDINR